MSKKSIWISRTAVLTALLVVLQFITKPLGQFVTGSAVNMVLTVSALTGGWYCALAVALISPFAAFLLGIGPAFIQVVPVVALGNLALVTAYCLLKDKLSRYLTVPAAAVIKFAVLYLGVVKLVVPALGLPAAKAAVLSTMFSWPQLVTALIGGAVGVLVSNSLKKHKK